ncbi:MAG TPA: hypothetical protein VFD49_02125 [Candidatus Dormibacteraeota bacterium]|nr:hypothetical protein [Candidatus Dormibacteraeota bacterium]
MKDETVPVRTPHCPFPSRLNPHVEAVHEHTVEWVRRFHLVEKPAAMERFMASRYTWLAARLYPTAGLEELQLLNDWMVWLFMFDDQFDDHPDAFSVARAEHILDDFRAVVVDPTLPLAAGLAVRALRDLCRRTYARMGSQWCRRYRRHVLQFFDTYVWTLGNSLSKTVPPLDVYIERRRHSGAMHIATDLIDLAEHLQLPEAIRQTPPISTLTRMAIDVVCWSNDIQSLNKELALGEVNNLVLVLQRERSLSLEQTVELVHDMIASEIRAFQKLERVLPAFPPALRGEVERYVDGLRACMRGNIDWSAETYRYSHVESRNADRPASYLEDLLTPTDGASA